MTMVMFNETEASQARLAKSFSNMTQSSKATVGQREKNRRDKHHRIVVAAGSLFTSKGVEGTSTSEIARKAGVAKGTLFLYAPNKADLLFMVMHDRLEQTVDEAIATLPKRKAFVPQMLHLFKALYVMYGASGSMGRELVRSLPGASGPNAQRVNALTFAFVHRLAGLVVEAQRKREIRSDVVPLEAAQNLFALYFAGLMAWLQGFMTIDQAHEQLLARSLDLQFRGLKGTR